MTTLDDRKREFNALTEADKQTFAALPETVESWDSLGDDARKFKKFYSVSSGNKGLEWDKIDFSKIRFSTTMGGGARKTRRKSRKSRKQRKQRKSRRTRRN